MKPLTTREFPGKVVGLERELDIPVDVDAQLEAASIALAGVFTFCADLCRPLSMDVQLTCRDAETDFPCSGPTPRFPFWMLRQSPVPPRTRIVPAWVNARIADVDRLTYESTLALVTESLAQSYDGGTDVILGWEELLFRAVSVRLPPDLDDRLQILVGTTPVDYPVEHHDGSRWATGPLHRTSVVSPMQLRVTKQIGVLTFEVSLFWSLWTEDGAAVDRAMNQVLTQGWSRP